MGVKVEFCELINKIISSWVKPSENNCLVDCMKLFLVYFSLSSVGVSTLAKSEGLNTSPVDNI